MKFLKKINKINKGKAIYLTAVFGLMILTTFLWQRSQSTKAEAVSAEKHKIAANGGIQPTESEPEISKNTHNFMPLPTGDTNYYVYMDLKSITDKSSLQYNLKDSYWLDDQGLYRHGNDYVVAMGTGYGSVGDRFDVFTETGNQYTVFLGDVKAPEHTDEKNLYSICYTEQGIKQNVIEFIVDIDKLDDSVRISGNIASYDNFIGRIAHIQKIS